MSKSGVHYIIFNFHIENSIRIKHNIMYTQYVYLLYE